MSSLSPQTIRVEPARLAPGEYRHDLERTVGEGDIYASYSADSIGMRGAVRKPFIWKGAPHVCVSFRYLGGAVAGEAYRLVHPSCFEGAPTTYAEKTFDGEAARSDALGFYHGMLVKSAGETLVMCGPPLVFMPGETAQLSLF